VTNRINGGLPPRRWQRDQAAERELRTLLDLVDANERRVRSTDDDNLSLHFGGAPSADVGQAGETAAKGR
jgi:hypothetical protein